MMSDLWAPRTAARLRVGQHWLGMRWTLLGVAALLAGTRCAEAQLLSVPEWTGADSLPLHDIACGDWDGDGDPDIAIAAEGGRRIYRNDGGIPVRAWDSSPPDEFSFGVDWADWDLDGDLDLAFGNGWATPPGEASTIHANQLGLMTLAWVAPELDHTIPVSWGDMDADGDPDLATGGTHVVRVYRNDVGSLNLHWTSSEPDLTHAVAWANWDGDGDLDLAVGNGLGNAVASRVYRNDGGSFTLAWTSAELTDTRSVAWADWDGDGDPDLASGNGSVGSQPQPNHVYRNDGGSLTLAWTSAELDNTASVAWGDWDGDGDPDLGVGNAGRAANRVYCNSGGVLELAWTALELDNTHAIDWADMDGDGVLDLVVGNNRQPSRIYLGCQRPRLAEGAALLGVKDGTGGAAFSWRPDLRASAYHLNGIAAKQLLGSPGAHRPPVAGGLASPECRSFGAATRCSDLDALSDLRPLLFYQVFSACGSVCSAGSGTEEGPP